jgi:hypothetical protein
MSFIIPTYGLLVDFTVSDSTPSADVPVNFTGVADATYWLWDFGDGTSSSTQSPTKTYTTPGSYDVTLFASKDDLIAGVRKYIGMVEVSAPDYAALFIAASGISGTEATAITQLVTDLQPIWGKFKAIYPIVGSTASTQKWNLMNAVDSDAANRISFNGTSGWTHDAYGASPVGDCWANTFIYPGTDAFWGGSNGGHMSIFIVDNEPATAGYDMGVFSDGVDWNIIASYGNDTGYGGMNSSGFTTYSNTSTNGYYVVSNTASANDVYKDGTLKVSDTKAFANLPGNAVTACIALGGSGRNNDASDKSQRKFSFATVGTALTAGEVEILTDAVAAYNTTLGR